MDIGRGWRQAGHGRHPRGAFTSDAGSVSIYDGARFASNGIVLVTINHRPSAEGFLSFDGVTPDPGLLDQIAALHWVRDIFAAFGGNPGNVTVFGESTGAMSIGALLAIPRAKGYSAAPSCKAARPRMSSTARRRS